MTRVIPITAARGGPASCPVAERRTKATAFLRATMTLLASSCATPRPVEGPVRLGEIAFVNGPKVRPDAVIEDSRCPIDVQCVQAGRVTVRVTVIGGGWSRQLDLTSGISVPVADGSLTLVAVTPQPRPAHRHDKPLPYRFTFAFQGGL